MRRVITAHIIMLMACLALSAATGGNVKSPCPTDTVSVTNTVAQDWDLLLYKTRVKLVDEFFERFNGNESRMDVDPDDADSRLKNLLLLFDSKMLGSAGDSLFAEARHMVDTVMACGIKLNYSDTAWVARAACQAKLNGKPTSVTLYLNVQSRGSDMYKWVIAKAEGEALSITPPVMSDRIMLLPDDHETDFMSLYRITTERDDYILNYAARGFTPDETTTFFTYVFAGLLDIERVSELEFIFLQVPGYEFTIKNITRDSFNAGWLISSFRRVTDEEKRKFLNTVYR